MAPTIRAWKGCHTRFVNRGAEGIIRHANLLGSVSITDLLCWYRSAAYAATPFLSKMDKVVPGLTHEYWVRGFLQNRPSCHGESHEGLSKGGPAERREPRYRSHALRCPCGRGNYLATPEILISAALVHGVPLTSECATKRTNRPVRPRNTSSFSAASLVNVPVATAFPHFTPSILT
jgi:hypothetical protein